MKRLAGRGSSCLGLVVIILSASLQAPHAPSLTQTSRRNHLLSQMAPKSTDRIQKKWMEKQIRHFASLKTISGVQKYQKTLLDKLDEKDTHLQSVRQ
jgi:hypothetical protein